MNAGIADDLRFDHADQKWHVWNGTVWEEDRTDSVYEVLRVKYAVPGLKDPASADNAKALQSVHKTNSVLKDLSSRPPIAMAGDEWDTKPWLLACSNGVVDLRNFTISPGDPDDNISRTTGVDFSPKATAPIFEKFLGEVASGDQDVVAFLLLWFGASLFGWTAEQRFLLMTGIGRNGKGALKHAILKAVGDYGAQFDANMYMRTKFGAARSDLARADLLQLKGKRITFFSEPEGNRFNEEMLKAHTGGDTISARALYSNNMQRWLPTHSITFLVNDAPEVEDVGPSMAARVMVADFRERFDGLREDKQLYGKLESEAEGILALLCRAAQIWYASYQGGGGLAIPQRVQEQSDAFMSRNDPLAECLRDRFIEGKGLTVHSKIAMDVFTEWMEAEHPDAEAPSAVRFAKMMEKKGFRKEKTNTGAVWKGLKPKSAMQLASEGADDDE
jgi:putative DNA primase/helicase